MKTQLKKSIKNEKETDFKKIVTIFTKELLGTYKYRIQGGYL